MVFVGSQEQININILFIGLENKIQKANSSIVGAKRKNAEGRMHYCQTKNERRFLGAYKEVSDGRRDMETHTIVPSL